MSADDQAFLDVLSSVPNDVKRYSSEVAGYLEHQADKAAAALKSALISIPWLPEYAKPTPPPRHIASASLVPHSIAQRVQDWVQAHKLLTGVMVLSVGAGSIYYFNKRRYRKRRAKRASNGARLEVVVLAGPPTDPITRSMALDLERRGFIVYVVCSTIEEEINVQNEGRTDIKPLVVDLIDPVRTRTCIENFAAQLQAPHYAFQGARAHYLTLKSLILIPSINYPSAPIATISPTALSELLSSRLLQPVLLLQAFLPLLTAPTPRQNQAQTQTSESSRPRVLILTPTIIPSLKPAFHAPESAVVAALDATAQSLRAELSSLAIPVIQLKLGTFDCTHYGAKPQQQIQAIQSQRAETLTWPEDARQAYARNYIAQASRGLTGVKGCGQLAGVKGTALKYLHYAVFDAMDAKNPTAVRRVGRGSHLYSFIGAWVPAGLVGWMMGLRKVEPFEYSDVEATGGELTTTSASATDQDYISVNRFRDAEKVYYE